MGALETLADQTQVRTPPHQDGALGRLHSEEEPQRRPWQAETALNGQRLCAGDKGQGAQDPAMGRCLPRAPRGQRTKPVMSLGEQEGAPEADAQERGFAGCVGVRQAERGKLREQPPREATDREQTRPWGLFTGNLSQLPGAWPWADVTQAL